jgi:hypothetical protein
MMKDDCATTIRKIPPPTPSCRHRISVEIPITTPGISSGETISP